MKHILILLLICSISFGQNTAIDLDAGSSTYVEGTAIDLDKVSVVAVTDYYAFQNDTFNFVTNQLIDKSGSDNHVTLKNASARTSTSGNLDYVITGILTTDAITVVSGSDLPTIPANGTLRIAQDSVVYGVTVRRSGAVWTIIPFCEPMMNENIPTISYDVSGNSRHATCATLAAGNVTTQDNYFYLAQYGYSEHASDLIAANFSSWTGAFPNERPTGLTFVNTSGVNNYVSNKNNQCLYRFKAAAGTADMKLRKLSILTIGKRYRTDIEVTAFDSVAANVQGLVISQADFSTPKQVRGTVGVWSNSKVATAVSWEMNRQYQSASFSIIFKEPKCYLEVIVPGLLSKNGNDALGNVLEYPQTGGRILRYMGDLSFPAATQTASYNYGLGGLIKSGSLYSGWTYKITKTQANYFGAGKVVGDTISDNDTICRYNLDEVRRIYSKGIFNADVKYDSLKSYLRDFYYSTKRYKTFANMTYNVDGTGFGNWYRKDNGYIDTLYVLNKTATDQHSTLVTALRIPETTEGITPISFVWDAARGNQLDSLNNMIDSIGAKYTYALNYGYKMTNANAITLAANGHELACHTPYADGAFLGTYKDFEDDLTNYTEAELQAYYDDIDSFFIANYGYAVRNKIYPGGSGDTVTLRTVLNYFDAGFSIVNNFAYIPFLTNTQFVTGLNPVQIANDFDIKSSIGRGAINDSTRWKFDEVHAANGFKVFYGHPEYEFSLTTGTLKGWAYFRKQLERITRMQKQGKDIRIYTVKDAMDLINNTLE